MTNKKKNKAQEADIQPEEDIFEEEIFEDEPEEEISELDELKLKLKEMEENMLRQVADADNYRKRLIRDSDDKVKYANQSLIKKFLPVLDNFDLALKHTEGVTVETVLEGVALNRKVMLDILEKEGLVPIETAEGDKFDPNVHEAIMLSNNPDFADNTITMVVQNGYEMTDRIIRPAKVQVNKVN